MMVCTVYNGVKCMEWSLIDLSALLDHHLCSVSCILFVCSSNTAIEPQRSYFWLLNLHQSQPLVCNEPSCQPNIFSLICILYLHWNLIHLIIIIIIISDLIVNLNFHEIKAILYPSLFKCCFITYFNINQIFISIYNCWIFH